MLTSSAAHFPHNQEKIENMERWRIQKNSSSGRPLRIESPCVMWYKALMFVDSHCHLEMDDFEEDRRDVVDRGIREGLRYILTVGTEANHFKKVIEILDTFPSVYGAIGIHPHNSSEWDESTEKTVLRYLRHEKIVAYGEIGLDFFKNYAARDTQIKAFEAQIEVAKRVKLPIVVHSRAAQEETIRILTEHMDRVVGGVIHCYSYGLDTARRFLDMGLYLSIPGTLTYKNAESLVEVVKYVPTGKMLAETDAPFLTPIPHRGKRNEPSFVKLTIARMAEARKIPLEEMAISLCENFERLFLNGIKGGQN